MRKSSFKVTGLHCSDEISLLKKVLGNHPGIVSLDFDLLQTKMTVGYEAQKIDHDGVIELVASTGMRASLWENRFLPDHRERKLRLTRMILTLLGSLFLVAGALVQMVNLPLARRLYFISILIGFYYVIPKAIASLRQFRADMNLLMAFAVIGAIAIDEWFEGATVTTLFSLALYLEEWSVNRARRAIEGLLNMAPTLARVIRKEGTVEERSVGEIAVGERIEVRLGEKIPLDGVVIEGVSAVDQAPITGESIPVLKEPGATCFAGTLNQEGRLVIETTKEAEKTTLAHIIRLVEEAGSKRAPAEQWVEGFARIYTPIMVVIALLTILIPPLFFNGVWTDWIYRGLVIAVIACPCALVISTPVSIVAALTSSARAGILIKGGRFLEWVGRLKALALDKTGTLTLGHPVVQKIIPLNGHTVEELLLRAAALEKPSNHPIARAILSAAQDLAIPPVENYQMIKGKGASGEIFGRHYWLGSHRFLHEMKQETPEIHRLALELEDAGHTIVIIGSEHHVCGMISVADSPRPHLKETIFAMKQAGLETIVMLTGDNEQTATALGKVAGIEEVRAELLPEEKVAAIQELIGRYSHVGMVGDGINDAPAMACATIGIAMGAMGTDVAIEAADIALMSDDLTKIPWLIRHSQNAVRIIQQNITFSLAIKALFIAMALLGRASLWLAILADTGASFCVIFNGLRLLRQR